MRLVNLILRNFRNYERLELRPHPDFNYLFGENGAGKTNFLEAVYYLSHLRSFRRVSRENMVAHESEGMYVAGAFAADVGTREVRLEAACRGRERKYRKDGEEVRSLMPYLESSHVIVFFPETPGVIKDGPGVRRVFFDRAIAALEPAHMEDSRRHARLLAERNRLLRNGDASGIIGVWQDRLIETAARIVARRKRYTKSLKNRLHELELLFGETREARVSVEYHETSGQSAEEEEEIRESLRARSESLAAAESARRTTLWGPQLDDFRLTWRGRRAREAASQGEQRLAAILLVAANAEEYKEKKGESPVVLLDDLGSELDPGRRMRVLSFLGSLGAQTFITSTDAFRHSDDGRGAGFLVRGGAVEQVD